MIEEVKFYFRNYQEFINSDNNKLVAVISALNNANIGRYEEFRSRYPGYLLYPEMIDINKLTTLVQSVFPAQVLRYNLGDLHTSNTTTKLDEQNKSDEAGLFPRKEKEVLRQDNSVNDSTNILN